MKPTQHRTSERQRLTQAHALAAVVACIAAGASALAGALGKLDAVPFPFVWRDVALVYLLSAMPLAASLAVVFTLRFASSQRILAVVALETLVLLIVPRLYIYARCQSDIAEVRGFIEQSRIGEAQSLANRVLRLNRHAAANGYPLKRLSDELDKAVRQIELRVAAPFNDATGTGEPLARARDLAMLGRTTQALAVLDSAPASVDSPQAHNLRAMIYETLSDWRAAGESYARARASWQSLPESTERAAGLLQANIGIAYSQRKLGRLHQAEAAFQEVLRLAPTADSHFLLAQFYEDTQQAAKAQSHAFQAAFIDPQKYGRQVEQLVDKLETSHFGCLSVLATKNDNFHPTTPRGDHR
jgi:tetratricopeptide (TPR) repeat protein